MSQPPKKSGCLGGCLGLGIKVAGVLVILLLVGSILRGCKDPDPVIVDSAPAPKVVTPPTLKVGDLAVLGDPGEYGPTGVWFATTEADLPELIAAEKIFAARGPGAGGPRTKMAEARRARMYQIGAEVRILGTSPTACHVEITKGPDQGSSGWVQTEFVKPLTRE